MITVNLMGGMGNQMFQAALSMALANQGYRVRLDRTKLIERTHREYSLDVFKFNSFPVEQPVGPIVREGSMKFDPKYLYPSDPCVLDGYWQSEKYFKNIEEYVRGAFSLNFDYVMDDHLRGLAYETGRRGTVSLHVRRKDYVGLEHFHGIMPIEYYRKALVEIERTIFVSKVFVFSDDVPWCQEYMPKEFAIVDRTSKYEDLWLMTKCENNVIVNSSFSWWGAWLNPNPKKIVVAPKQWFADPSENSQAGDIVPEGWIKI